MLDGICGPAQAEQRHQRNDDGHRHDPTDGMTFFIHAGNRSVVIEMSGAVLSGAGVTLLESGIAAI